MSPAEYDSREVGQVSEKLAKALFNWRDAGLERSPTLAEDLIRGNDVRGNFNTIVSALLGPETITVDVDKLLPARFMKGIVSGNFIERSMSCKSCDWTKRSILSGFCNDVMCSDIVTGQALAELMTSSGDTILVWELFWPPNAAFQA
jgi:hypothetical protein